MKRYLIAEFEKQSFVQIIFPHVKSDWIDYLEEARECFVNIAKAVAKYEQCLIVCDDIDLVKGYFNDHTNLVFLEYQTNDTWARDCSGITVLEDDKPKILDFTFTGWGGKFDASRDNAMTQTISNSYSADVVTVDMILEGGAIETNAKGVLLTTSECLLNPNRNAHLSKEQSEKILKDEFGVEKILWLNSGYLAGDDTDSHIDTLARFIDEESIMYVKCDDEDDEHYEALKKMEDELKSFADINGKPFKLIALPMTDAIYFEDERIPATYANFLIINGAVLVPTYNDSHDEEALTIFKNAFSDRDIIGIDCSVLIRQHGSLHCVTMQFPEVVKISE
jgi:agmatine deiminase